MKGGFLLNVQELGKLLGEMYNKEPHGNQVAKIHLFGVILCGCHTKKPLQC